ncbi:hypothetical protein CEXT_433271 [Caerostris extrusa]|uniref:Uncharacterized protein n=1 Tax=Caerostris extrusa TaxID=172846 RepID=A0AAV4QXX6_CAEEX|nr:hypothetical protein CEXT_433271 [Caerostris extrusa]
MNAIYLGEKTPLTMHSLVSEGANVINNGKKEISKNLRNNTHLPYCPIESSAGYCRAWKEMRIAQSPVINKGLGRGSLGFGEDKKNKEHENQNKCRFYGIIHICPINQLESSAGYCRAWKEIRIAQSPVINKGLGRGSLGFGEENGTKKSQEHKNQNKCRCE